MTSRGSGNKCGILELGRGGAIEIFKTKNNNKKKNNKYK